MLEGIGHAPFGAQYGLYLRARVCLGLGSGPVDILGTPGDTLLAAWLGGSAVKPCPESLLARAGGDTLVALRASDAVSRMHGTDAKRRAQHRVSWILRRWGLPGRGVKLIRWDPRLPRDMLDRVLQSVR